MKRFLTIITVLACAVTLIGNVTYAAPGRDDLVESTHYTSATYLRQGEFGAYVSSGEISGGELDGYWYNNYRYGYTISKSSASDFTGLVGEAIYDRDGDVVYARGGEWVTGVSNGELIISAIPFSEMQYIYSLYGYGLVRSSLGITGNELDGEFVRYIGNLYDKGYNLGISINEKPYLFEMTGIRFHYGDSETANFIGIYPSDFNYMSIDNAFLAFVPDSVVGEYCEITPADSGYSIFLLEGEYYEEYVRQQAKGNNLGVAVTERDTDIIIDGVTYKGQVFTKGYIYRDGSKLVSDCSRIYYPKTATFEVAGVENFIRIPVWFTEKSVYTRYDAGDVIYFNYGIDCVIATKTDKGYTYEYYGRKKYNPETGKLEIVEYTTGEELAVFSPNTDLWNGQNTLNAIKLQYPEMDQEVSLEQFESDVTNAFRDAYRRYTDAGFSLGYVSGQRIMYWGNFIMLNFIGSDGGGRYADTDETAFLIYNPVMKKAFALYGPMLSALATGLYGTDLTFNMIGAPTGEIIYIDDGSIYDGSVYQNYTKGYYFLEKSNVITRKFVEGKSYDHTVDEIPFNRDMMDLAEQEKADREQEWQSNSAYRDYLNGNKGCAASASFLGLLAVFCVIFTRRGLR
ncbi:MAG: hypothetical protein ACI4S9_06835 [Christensenellales bacterium]